MERGLLAPLSLREESALRRVANGISKPGHLREGTLARLTLLKLVEVHDGRAQLTALGQRRCAERQPPASPPN